MRDAHNNDSDESTETACPANGLQFAGFWQRIVATVIDGVVLSVICAPFIGPWLVLYGRTFSGIDFGDFKYNLALVLAGCAPALQWLYFALFESSSHGGSPGKWFVGARITDINGNTMSFWNTSIKLLVETIIVFALTSLVCLVIWQHTTGGFSAPGIVVDTAIFLFIYTFILCSRKKQSLVDLATRRLVILDPAQKDNYKKLLHHLLTVPQRNGSAAESTTEGPPSKSDSAQSPLSGIRVATVAVLALITVAASLFSVVEIRELLLTHYRVESVLQLQPSGEVSTNAPLERRSPLPPTPPSPSNSQSFIQQARKQAPELYQVYKILMQAPLPTTARLHWCNLVLALNPRDEQAQTAKHALLPTD